MGISNQHISPYAYHGYRAIQRLADTTLVERCSHEEQSNGWKTTTKVSTHTYKSVLDLINSTYKESFTAEEHSVINQAFSLIEDMNKSGQGFVLEREFENYVSVISVGDKWPVTKDARARIIKGRETSDSIIQTFKEAADIIGKHLDSITQEPDRTAFTTLHSKLDELAKSPDTKKFVHEVFFPKEATISF